MKTTILKCLVVSTIVVATASSAIGQRTAMISVNNAGSNGGNGNVGLEVSMSEDGRFVAFVSSASDLCAINDSNAKSDVFLRDTHSGVTSLVSVNSTGTHSGSDYSHAPTLSADGRFVAFWSRAGDLVDDDDYGSRQDVFVRDLRSGTTTRIQAGGLREQYLAPKISGDGRYVFFISEASYLVPNDVNNILDIFVRDMQTNQTTMITRNFLNTTSANQDTSNFQISSDGKLVVFTSFATNLVPDDTNATEDVFVRDMTADTTVRVSVDSQGVPGDKQSNDAAISGNGRFVSFTSASKLAHEDKNKISDVYVHDLIAHTTTVASIDSTGTFAVGASGGEMSADGRYVLLRASDGYLVPNDTGGDDDLFVRDMLTGVTTLASGDVKRAFFQYALGGGDISPNGRYVTFYLERDFLNRWIQDIYVRDMVKGTTSMLTLNLAGTAGGNDVSYHQITGNSSILFRSGSSDLVSNDTNNKLDLFAFNLSRSEGDYDGDGKSDLATWTPANGIWSYKGSLVGSIARHQWGSSILGDQPVQGDYDGDGKTDFAVFRTSDSNWYILLSSNNTWKVQSWGLATDKPVPADYDGDGKTDVAVFRPSNGAWYILQSRNNTFRAEIFGLSDDKPVMGDYDGDGKADLAVVRPSESTWYILQSSINSMRSQLWGISTDKPVQGDYDGDGTTDIATFRMGSWTILRSSDNMTENFIVGTSGGIPVPADFDGDGKTDPAVFMGPLWTIRTSSDGTLRFPIFGESGAIPVSSAYVVE